MVGSGSVGGRGVVGVIGSMGSGEEICGSCKLSDEFGLEEELEKGELGFGAARQETSDMSVKQTAKLRRKKLGIRIEKVFANGGNLYQRKSEWWAEKGLTMQKQYDIIKKKFLFL